MNESSRLSDDGVRQAGVRRVDFGAGGEQQADVLVRGVRVEATVFVVVVAVVLKNVGI